MLNLSSIQRAPPFGDLHPLRRYPLLIEDIRPVVRIAHRRSEPLNIAERIIFDYEIVLILAGHGAITTGTGIHPFHAHDLLCIPPFAPHAFSTARETLMEHVAIHFDFAPGIPRSRELDRRAPYEVTLSHGYRMPLQTPLVQGHRIGTEVLSLLRERSSTSPLAPLAATQHAIALLIGILREAPTSPTSLDPAQALNRVKVQRSATYILDHLVDELTPRDLASVAGLSVSRLNAVFRRETGRSPRDFVRQARIDAARRLLADDALSIKEVAALVGFPDPYHFSKAFRKIDGLSPSHFRAAALAGIAEAPASGIDKE